MVVFGAVASDAVVSERFLLSVASDVSNSGNNNFANVTGLTWTVASGTVYKFYAVLLFTTAATTTGVRFSMNGPSITRGAWNIVLPPISGSAPYAPGILTQTAFDTGTASASLPTTDNLVCIIDGFVQPSASGTMAVRFANEVNTSAVVVKAGSTCEWWV